MSRKMNRRQMSPVKIKSNTEQKRGNPNANINRIINHAAKLISEYNRNKLEKLLDEDLDNQAKINILVKESMANLPKISLENDPKLSRKRKRKRHSTGKNKKNNTENESDKLEYNYSFEDQYTDGNQQTLQSDKHRTSLQSKISVISIKLDQKMEDLSNHNDDIILKSISPTISSDLSIERSASCSVCSEKHVSKKDDTSNSQNISDLKYIYEVEIKTGNEKAHGENVNVAIQLYGESKNMDQSIKLNETNSNGDHAKLFTPGNVDKFSIVLDECLGSILRVKIGIESVNDDELWDLDYLCIRDCLHKSDYFFSCRRCLGINSSDKLTEVTLVYTPPFKMNKHESLSKSNTENLDEEQSIGLFKFKKLNSKSNNSSRSHSSLSQQLDQFQKSEQIQQVKVDQNFSDKQNKSDEKKRSRNRKRSSTISNDGKGTISLQRSLSSPELDKKQSNDEVYFMKPLNHDMNIHSAVMSHNVLRVKQLCENDQKKKDEIYENGCRPIHLASVYFQDKEECKEILQYLMSLGIDINTKSINNLTCLHYAVIENNLLAVKYLIKYCGADPDITDENGDTSLQIAKKYNFPEIAKYLAKIKRSSESMGNNCEFTDSNSNVTIGLNVNHDLIKKNEPIKDFDRKDEKQIEPSENVETEFKITSISKEKYNSPQLSESSDSEQSDNSSKSQLMGPIAAFSNSSSVRKTYPDSRRLSSSSSEKIVMISTPDPIVESISKSSSPTDIKEMKPSIAVVQEPNSSRSIDSKEGTFLLEQPILINNLNLTPISISSDDNSVKTSDNSQSIKSERKEVSKIKSDKDSLDNLESRQLEAESYGLMIHKSLPDREKRKESFSSNESKSSKTNSNNSGSINIDKPSDMKQINRNSEEEIPQNSNPVAENLEIKNDHNSMELSVNVPVIQSKRKTFEKTIVDKDDTENLESRQLDAESQGIMLHKSLPNRKELFSDELSVISSNENESNISSGNSAISTITPRSNSIDDLSDIVETKQNKSEERSNKNLVKENVNIKTENHEDNNENFTQPASSEENTNKNNYNLSKTEPFSNDTQQDHSVVKDQLQTSPKQSS